VLCCVVLLPLTHAPAYTHSAEKPNPACGTSPVVDTGQEPSARIVGGVVQHILHVTSECVLRHLMGGGGVMGVWMRGWSKGEQLIP